MDKLREQFGEDKINPHKGKIKGNLCLLPSFLLTRTTRR
jgi:hypothetical protein